MEKEYQINIEYADGVRGVHLTYRFENAKVRNEVYQLVCSMFIVDRVNMEHLRDHGGVTVSTYDYSYPVGNEMAQFVPHSYYKIEFVKDIIALVEQNALN